MTTDRDRLLIETALRRGMRGGTLFSGIGAPETAATGIDWRWCAEIDRFPSAVMAARHPHVKNLGDVTKVDWTHVEPVDVLVFGSPCQSFSIAGKRLGLDDPRGNLALVGLGIARRLRPRWLVFENVPGLLSLDDGDAWRTFVRVAAECGYFGAWGVLNAQYFGVPQRRRRLFFVGYLGDWRPAASVLLEPESLSGNPPPRREAGQGIARPVAAGSPGGSGYRNDADTADNLIAFGGNNRSGAIDVASALNGHGGPHGRLDFTVETFVAHALRADGFDASEDGAGRGTPLGPVAFDCKAGGKTSFSVGEQAGALRGDGHGGGHAAVAFHQNQRGEITVNETTGTLKTGGGKPGQGYPAAMVGAAVRRLTPRECERLQGFPEDYTRIVSRIYKSKPKLKHFAKYPDLYEPNVDGTWTRYAADGPRYKALGNSMAPPVIRWILDRVQAVDAMLTQMEAA